MVETGSTGNPWKELQGRVEIAMRGEYPWVISADDICGGGGQVLSEVVKGWIRRKNQVAKRPKNYSGGIR